MGRDRAGTGFRGVSGDELAAVGAVVPALYDGTAEQARVESARLTADMIAAGYQRTGFGWTARAVDGGIRWEPIGAQEPARA